MSQPDLPEDFLQIVKKVTAKRPKTVIDHILAHGRITTEELKDLYGYNHPPRAIRDVRENGIPLKTIRVTGSDGRKIAAYTFGDLSEVRSAQLSGRTAFSSTLKAELIKLHGQKCNITRTEFPSRELQIDHRIPFEIAGDDRSSLSENPDEYMLVCASANREKSWSCENCPNWELKDRSVCETCYWAFPESFEHVATRQHRRMDIIWSEGEITDYNRAVELAADAGTSPQEFVKSILREL